MDNTTPTWTDAHGHEHQLCGFCGVDCSTHPDAGNPLSCCGDCGRATCPDHRVDDQAARCVECAATFYAEPTPVAATPRPSRRYQTCAHSHCTQPARIGFTMCAGHANADRFAVVCMECGRRWWMRRYADVCPKCGGADIEVAEDAAARQAREDAANTEAQRYV